MHVYAEIRGDRRCLHRLTPITGKDAKRYCGDRCRGAAKQARFRENDPRLPE